MNGLQTTKCHADLCALRDGLREEASDLVLEADIAEADGNIAEALELLGHAQACHRHLESLHTCH